MERKAGGGRAKDGREGEKDMRKGEYRGGDPCISLSFSATICKTIRPMLSGRCLSVCSSPVCNVGILWPNGWTDQDETWRADRSRP